MFTNVTKYSNLYLDRSEFESEHLRKVAEEGREDFSTTEQVS